MRSRRRELEISDDPVVPSFPSPWSNPLVAPWPTLVVGIRVGCFKLRVRFGVEFGDRLRLFLNLQNFEE